MTVSNTTDRVSYDGDGSTTVFAYTFPTNATSDLVVKTRTKATGAESTLTETTDYTATAGESGGSVTTVATYTSATEIHIIRVTPKTQTLDLTTGGTVDVERLEDAHDKAMRLAIEAYQNSLRSVRIPTTEGTFDELPNSVDRASKYLYFDASGDPTAASVVSATTLTTTAWGQNWMVHANDSSARLDLDLGWIDVRDYGATGDGATDDTTSIQNALTAGTNQVVYFPAGSYRTTAALTLPRYVRIIGDTKDTSKIYPEHTNNCFELTYGTDTTVGIFVRDIQIVGDKTTYVTGNGWHLENCAGASFEDCIVGTMGDDGWNVSGGWHIDFTRCYSGNNGAVNFNIDTPHCNVVLCETDGGTYGVYAADLADGLAVTNSHFEGASVAGLTLYAATGTVLAHGKITANYFISNPIGIQSAGAGTGQVSNWTVVGNRVLTTSNTAFDWAAPVGLSSTITGNRFTATTYGVRDRSAGYNIYTANYIEGDKALSIEAANVCVCTGNYLNGATNGILNVTGNHIYTMNYELSPTPDPATTAGTPQIIRVEGSGFDVNTSLTIPTYVAGADGATQGTITLWDGAGGNTPGYVKIHSPNGTAWYLFVEDDGTVKVHSAAPTANTDGSEVGAQT